MWVIFEGLDKSGKTTLEWAFLKATNYKINVVDRGPIGYMVFDEIFNRSTKLGNQEFIRQARKINKSKDCYVVYCRVDNNIANQRLKDHNEKCPYNYSNAQKIMKNKMIRYYDSEHMLILDTSLKSIDECTEDIVKWFKEVSK